MSVLAEPISSGVVLDHIPWQTYEQLRDQAMERRLRFTYDRGELEIMVLGLQHEHFSRLLLRMIAIITLELSIPIRSGGSTTLQRRQKLRGLEADECFWIQHEARMRGKREFNLASDPPPDLAVEVDISRSSMDRMGIYAALRIREIWRFNGRRLRVHLLRKDGTYRIGKRSAAFPFLPMAVIEKFLHESDQVDETSLLQSFTAWVRSEVQPHYDASKSGNGKK